MKYRLKRRAIYMGAASREGAVIDILPMISARFYYVAAQSCAAFLIQEARSITYFMLIISAVFAPTSRQRRPRYGAMRDFRRRRARAGPASARILPAAVPTMPEGHAAFSPPARASRLLSAGRYSYRATADILLSLRRLFTSVIAERHRQPRRWQAFRH